MHYTSDEIESLTDYIEDTFGPVETIAHEVSSDDFHIDLAIIPPHDRADYYTICTMGHGAHEFESPDGMRRQEFVLHLPPHWNVTGEGYDKMENWWPTAMLKYVSRSQEYYGMTDLLDFGKPFTECSHASGVFFIACLLDFYHSSVVTLPTGKIVEFRQIVPVCADDVEKYDRCRSKAERFARILGIDVSRPFDISLSAGRDAILRHFESMVKLD